MKRTLGTLGAVVALQAILVIGDASAATVFLSDKGIDTGPDIGVNPTITLNVGETKQLHLWVQLEANVEHMVGLAGDILNDTAGIAQATGFAVYNPTVGSNVRWEDGYDPGSLDELINGFVLPAVTTNGLDATDALVLAGNDPYYDVASSSFLGGTMEVHGLAVGSTDVYMSLDTVGMLQDPVIIQVGWGDEPLVCAVGGRCGPSALADATIVVLPEPVSLAVLALGGVFILRRQRT